MILRIQPRTPLSLGTLPTLARLAQGFQQFIHGDGAAARECLEQLVDIWELLGERGREG